MQDHQITFHSGTRLHSWSCSCGAEARKYWRHRSGARSAAMRHWNRVRPPSVNLYDGEYVLDMTLHKDGGFVLETNRRTFKVHENRL